MKANELRIGNLIKWISTGSIEKVMDIVTYDKNEDNVNNVNISDCTAIQLTEEWLIMFGFEEWKTEGEFKHKFIVSEDDIYELYIYTACDNDWVIQLYNIYDVNNKDDHTYIALPITCKYVHQLQNLYFALTGEELTIKRNIK